jgi:hypothetical protein
MATISTGDLDSYFAKIHSDIVSEINCASPYNEKLEYVLLANKIIMNLQSASILAARGGWGDSKILIRSAFETFIHLKIFQHYPERLQEWKNECELISFRNSFVLHKHFPQELPETELIRHYETLPDEIKSKCPLEKDKIGNIVYYDKNKLNKRLENFKSKFSNIRKLIEDIALIEPAFDSYNKFRFTLYDENSQIAHGDFSQIVKFYINPESQDPKEQLTDFIRQYALILVQMMQALAKILDKNFDNFYPQFMSNLGALPIGPSRIQQAFRQKSNIISVRTNPIATIHSYLYDN